MMSKVHFFTASTLILSVALGCSSRPSDTPELAPVSGVVLMDGEPLEGASVTFSPVNGGRGAAGSTDAEGRFRVAYIKYAGCPPGDCSVTVSTFGEILDEFGGVEGMRKETVPKRYRGDDSELQVTVKPGESNEFKFELTSVGETDDLE